MHTRALIVFLSLMSVASLVAANPGREAILTDLADQAKSADATFRQFSVERGGALFEATHIGGKPLTPSCTTCHGPSARRPGKTRVGKVIAPMAVSKTPDRYTDAKKVKKWFRRNCKSVLGRECTAVEKGDFLTFMISQ